MSVWDFEGMSPAEYAAVGSAWDERRKLDERDSWERMRLLATICIQPHVKRRMKPTDLFKFPWDKGDMRDKMRDASKKKPKEVLSKAESLRRFEEVLRKVEKNEEKRG